MLNHDQNLHQATLLKAVFRFSGLFTDLTYVHCRVKDNLPVYIKITPSCIQKKKLKLSFCVWTRWLDLKFMNLFFPLKYHPATLERQLNYLKYFAIMFLWQSSDLSAMLCHESFQVQCLLSTYWKLLPLTESIWFFFLWFLNHRVWEVYSIQKLCQECISLFLML